MQTAAALHHKTNPETDCKTYRPSRPGWGGEGKPGRPDTDGEEIQKGRVPVRNPCFFEGMGLQRETDLCRPLGCHDIFGD